MNRFCKDILIVISIIGMLYSSGIYAQENKFSYQIILETGLDYNNLYKNSEVNPKNWMKISDFTSKSNLYPIIEFDNEINGINTKLQVEGDFQNYNFDKDSTLFSFQELYGQIDIKSKHYLVFGKKRLDWGTGMIWNPTNFFIQKDPLRVQNRLEGIFMLNYSYLFEKGALSFYAFPEKKINDGRLAFKYDYSNERIDGSLSFLQYGKYQQFGYDISYGGDHFTAYSEGVLRNFTKSYQISDQGEVKSPIEQKKRFWAEVVAGTSILLNNLLTMNVEYRYRQDYLNRKSIGLYKFFCQDNPLFFDAISVSRHSLYGNLTYKDIYNRWSINLRAFYDPLSNQILISPLGTFTLNNFQIEASIMGYSHSLTIYNMQSTILVSYFF